jgi:type I restriction enzyme M protein
LDIYKDKEEIQYVSKLVPNDDIAKEDYNLSVSTYVEIEDTREKIDIEVLNKEIKEIVEKQEALRKEIDKIVVEIEEG